MMSLKGLLKYLIYIFLAGWMFLLGIMVGRGTSPVKFDTGKFQERLEAIAREHGSKKSKTPEKPDLEYYSVLNHPIPTEGNPDASRKNSQRLNQGLRASGEIIPKKEPPKPARKQSGSEPSDEIKTSLKKATYKKTAPSGKKVSSGSPVSSKKKTARKQEAAVKEKKPAVKVQKKADASKQKKADDGKAGKGIYTIQVAAYKDLKDAVIEMTRLEKKGFRSYRIETVINGVTWYRVRTGSFATYEQAKAVNDKLKKARIKSIITKKGS